MKSYYRISLAALVLVASFNAAFVLAGPNDASAGRHKDPATDNGTGPQGTNENSAIRPNSGKPNSGQGIEEFSTQSDGMRSASPQSEIKAPGLSSGNTVGTDPRVGAIRGLGNA